MARMVLSLDDADLECAAAAAPALGANGQGTSVGAVILHPWGKLGGCMDDPTVEATFVAAARSGLFDVVVSYNMRGVGRSRGKRRAPGDADANDLVALCRRLLAAPLSAPGLEAAAPPPRRLVLIGYSYGSVVAASALARVPEAVAFVSIGFPLGLMCRVLLGAGAAWDALAASPLPKLVIMGDADNFTNLDQLQAAAERHNAAPRAGPLDIRILPGADHFLRGRWDAVAAAVVAWLAQELRPPPAGAAAAAAAAAEARG